MPGPVLSALQAGSNLIGDGAQPSLHVPGACSALSLGLLCLGQDAHPCFEQRRPIRVNYS